MSWLGDMERNDPAYPGKPSDISTTGWSRLDAEAMDRQLRAEEEAELAPYRGRHRRP